MTTYHFDISACHIEYGFITHADAVKLGFELRGTVALVTGTLPDALEWAARINAVQMDAAQVAAWQTLYARSTMPPVSRAQGKTALITNGLWPSVLTYIASIEDTGQRMLAEVALHDTQEWKRTSPVLNAMAFGLGLTDVQLDALFTSAAEVSL